MPQAPQGPSIPPHAQQYQPQLLQQSRAVAPYPDDYPYNMPQDQRQPGGGYPQLASPLPPYHPYQFSSRVDRQSLMSFASSKQAFFNATMDVSAMYLAPTMVHTPPGAVNHPNATNFAPHASQTISPRYIFDTPPTVLSAPPFPQPLKWSQAHCDVPNTDDRHWDLGAQYAQHSYTIPVNPGGTTDSNVNAIMRPNLIVTSDAVVTSPSGLPSIAPIAPTRRPTSQGRATNIAGGFCDSVMPLSQSNMVPEKLFSANIGGGTPGMNVCPTSGAFVPGTTSDGEDLAALPDLASFSWTVVNDQRAPLDANMQRWESSDLKSEFALAVPVDSRAAPGGHIAQMRTFSSHQSPSVPASVTNRRQPTVTGKVKHNSRRRATFSPIRTGDQICRVSRHDGTQCGHVLCENNANQHAIWHLKSCLQSALYREGTTPGSVQCPWNKDTGRCEQSIRKAGLSKHIRDVHLRISAKRCDGCGKMFSRKDAFIRHFNESCKQVL